MLGTDEQFKDSSRETITQCYLYNNSRQDSHFNIHKFKNKNTIIACFISTVFATIPYKAVHNCFSLFTSIQASKLMTIYWDNNPTTITYVKLFQTYKDINNIFRIFIHSYPKCNHSAITQRYIMINCSKLLQVVTRLSRKPSLCIHIKQMIMFLHTSCERITTEYDDKVDLLLRACELEATACFYYQLQNTNDKYPLSSVVCVD